MIAGIPVDTRAVAETPRLVIAGGLDRYTPLDDAERLAEWLDAEFEPFGAHSHYGLIHGEIELPAGGRGPPQLPRDASPVGASCRVGAAPCAPFPVHRGTVPCDACLMGGPTDSMPL